MIVCKIGGTLVFSEAINFSKKESYPDIKVCPRYNESRSSRDIQTLVAFGKEVVKRAESFANVCKDYGNIDQGHLADEIKEIEKGVHNTPEKEFNEFLNFMTLDKGEKEAIAKKASEGLEKNKEEICKFISKNRNQILNLIGIN